MDSVQKLILEYSKGESGYWLNCFAWQKIPVKPLKYNRFTPPEAIPQ